MAVVSVRLSDAVLAEIDRLAAMNGQSRAAWMSKVLATEVILPKHEEVPLGETRGRGHPDDAVRVTVRLSRSEIEAIDAVGEPMGLTRNEWIKRTLRWALWDKAGTLRLCPVSQGELGKLRKQIIKIGRNINQAVHAMNAANMPGSSLDIARIAGPFLETIADLRPLLRDARFEATSYAGSEVAYWTGAMSAAERTIP